MSNLEAKANILNKIKKALEQPTPLPFPEAEGKDFPFQPQQADLLVAFAEQFTLLQGKFIFCATNKELVESFDKLCYQNQWTQLYCTENALKTDLQKTVWYEDIISCEAAVTGCEALVSRTGTMVLTSSANNRIPSVYAPIHVCVAYTSQLVYDVKDALIKLTEKYKGNLPSLISFATGPSRTADIEKTLVVGVHGPKEVYCFLVDDLGHHPS